MIWPLAAAPTRAKFRARTVEHLGRSTLPVTREYEAMVSRHSIAGRLQSGATAIEAVEIFETHTRRALDEALAEAGKLIEHRGRKWAAALAGIDDALEEHVAMAPGLERPLRLADATGEGAASRAAELRKNEAGERLRARVADFRDGWTAPIPKMWKDRHPFWYAVMLLLFGALIGFGLSLLKSALEATPAAAPLAEPSEKQ